MAAEKHVMLQCDVSLSSDLIALYNQNGIHVVETRDVCDAGLFNKRLKTLSAATHKCDVCEREFSQPGALATHKRIHTGQKPFACTICDKKFRYKGNLVKHGLSHSSDLKNPTIQKTATTNGNPDTSHDNQNSENLIENKEVSHKCIVCDKVFAKKSQLKSHKRSHRRPSDISGQENGNFSQKKQGTRKHKGSSQIQAESHILKKNISLDSTGQLFPDNSTMMEIDCIESGGGIEPGKMMYIDMTCLKKYNSPNPDSIDSKLKESTKFGMIREYQCAICDMVFDYTAQREFDRHQLNHELEATESTGIDYICIHCDATFDLASQLLEHGKQHKFS